MRIWIKQNRLQLKVIAACLFCILIAALLFHADGKKSLPERVAVEIAFHPGDYYPEQQGLVPLVEKLRTASDLPEQVVLDRLDMKLSLWGRMESFEVSLFAYEDSKYCGTYHFSYQSGRLTKETVSSQSGLSPSYNANKDVAFLSGQLERLPLTRQMALMGGLSFHLTSQGIEKLEEGEPVINLEGKKSIFSYTQEEYRNWQGGAADGRSAVIFTLGKTKGNFPDGLQIKYRCEVVDPETISGNRDTGFEFDYTIRNNEIALTRDYGETWIPVPLPEGALAGTLSFYRNGLAIPPYSYYIGPESQNLALLYGEYPNLMLSNDNGEKWENVSLDTSEFQRLAQTEGLKAITRRFIRFPNQKDGFIALGTDYSMGTGELKKLYITHDAGKNWEDIEILPDMMGAVLTGMDFLDENRGILSLKRQFDGSSFPQLFYTENGGKDWTEFNIPWDQLPKEVDVLEQADSLSEENGVLTLELRYSDRAVSYISHQLAGDWAYQNTYFAKTDTVG